MLSLQWDGFANEIMTEGDQKKVNWKGPNKIVPCDRSPMPLEVLLATIPQV